MNRNSIKIDHIAVYVEHLDEMKLFFEKYFHAVVHPLYHNPKTGLSTYFLSFGNETTLELMTRSEVETIPHSRYLAGFTHLAFSVGGREYVDRLTESLHNDGYEILSGPRMTGDGYYESCILGPEEIQIEITE